MQSQDSCSELMNNTITWQITVQPWQISKILTLRLTRASYNRHGRQVWDTLRQLEVTPDMLEWKIQDMAQDICTQHDAWRIKLDGDQADEEAGLSYPYERLRSNGGEQGDRRRYLPRTTDQGDSEDHHDEPGGGSEEQS